MINEIHKYNSNQIFVKFKKFVKQKNLLKITLKNTKVTKLTKLNNAKTKLFNFFLPIRRDSSLVFHFCRSDHQNLQNQVVDRSEHVLVSRLWFFRQMVELIQISDDGIANPKPIQQHLSTSGDESRA